MQCYFNSTLTCCLISLCFLQLAGADGHEYHFKHRTLPHARTRRSLTHTRALKSHPSVSININQDQSQTERGRQRVHSVECQSSQHSQNSLATLGNQLANCISASSAVTLIALSSSSSSSCPERVRVALSIIAIQNAICNRQTGGIMQIMIACHGQPSANRQQQQQLQLVCLSACYTKLAFHRATSRTHNIDLQCVSNWGRERLDSR